MKTAGDYALLHANGTSFAEIVKMIRDEQAQYLRANGIDYFINDTECVWRNDELIQWGVYAEREEVDGA